MSKSSILRRQPYPSASIPYGGDPAVIESWLVGRCAELSNAGIDIPKLREDAKRLRQELPAAGKAACIAWLEQNHL